MLLLLRKILISTLANSLHKMNITRKILICAGIFVNGSKNKFRILLSLLAQAGVERVEHVLMLKSADRKLIENFENPGTRKESPEPLPNPGASNDDIKDAITLHSSDEEYAD